MTTSSHVLNTLKTSQAKRTSANKLRAEASSHHRATQIRAKQVSQEVEATKIEAIDYLLSDKEFSNYNHSLFKTATPNFNNLSTRGRSKDENWVPREFSEKEQEWLDAARDLKKAIRLATKCKKRLLRSYAGVPLADRLISVDINLNKL